MLLAPVVKNVSGEIIPPFGLMRVTNVTTNDNRLVLEVDKPNGDTTAKHVINGKLQVQIDGYGSYQDPSNQFIVLTNETDGFVGPINDSWVAGLGTMFCVTGPVRTTAPQTALVSIGREVTSVELIRCSDGLRAFADNVAVGTQRLADLNGQVVNVADSALLRSECWTVGDTNNCPPEICPTVLGTVPDCDSCVPTCFNLTLCTDTTFVRKIMQPFGVFLQPGDVVALFDELCYTVSLADDCVDAEIIELSQSQIFDDCSLCGPACFDLTPCPGETADAIVARSGVSQVETMDTSEDDTIEFDFNEVVGKVVRLDDGVCYIVSVHAGDCTEGVDDVVVLETYDDCSTCLVYTLDRCGTSDQITTYSDLSEYGVGTVIRRAEDEMCYEIVDSTAMFDATAVEVMVEESFTSCENCTDPIFKLEPTCPSCEEANPGMDCEANPAATPIAGSGQTEYTDEDLTDHLERYVKVDGVCYFVERDPTRQASTLTSLEITNSFEDCVTCQKQCVTMVVDVIDGTGAIQQKKMRVVVDMVCDEITEDVIETTEDCPPETP